tara:strand:+ start:11546 stop:13828 length:2283 start_codon:yes stop_codon:yes gene_type:complete
VAPPSDLGPLELPPGLTKGGGKPGKKTTSVEDVGGGDSKEDKMADLGSGATDQSKTTIEKGSTDDPGAVVQTEDPTIASKRHKFKIFTPMDVLSSGILGASLQGSIEFSYANFISEYNFSIPKYEEISSLDTIPETILPNLYVLESVRNLKDTQSFLGTISQKQKNVLLKHAALIPAKFGAGVWSTGIKTETSPVFHYEKSDAGYLEKKKSGYKTYIKNQDYYDSWTKAIKEFLKQESDSSQPIAKKFKNIIVPINNVKWLADKANFKEMHPYTVSIEFTTDIKTEFADILEEAKLSRMFMQMVYGPNGPAAQKSHIEVATPAGNLGGGKVTKRFLRHWDIAEWFSSVKDLYEDPSGDFTNFSDAVSLGFGGESSLINDTLVKALHLLIFKAKTEELLKAKARTPNQAISDIACYSETAFYRIEKRDSKNNVIQNYWIPNSSRVNVVKLIDSQVKYFKGYRYKIYAYQIVIGDKPSTTAGPGATFGKAPWLVEIPYAESQDILISDKPPLPPDVNMIPYKGVDNKILISLVNQVGEVDLVPKVIESADRHKVIGYYMSQDIDPVKDSVAAKLQRKLSYGGDDHAFVYQIYRLPTIPLSYEDFRNKLHAAVYEPISSYVDDILPNKKYYYTFRVFDSHGNFSNPTHVYEVEMVSNDGVIYPIINIFSEKDLIMRQRQINKRLLQKPMKRYIFISPTFAQGLVEIADQDKDNISLGQKANKVFGRKFKIRLCSRQTGKKIDFNVDFKHEHLVGESEGDGKKK